MRVSIYDTTLNIDTERKKDAEAFKKMMSFMGSIGFFVGEDKEIKKRFPLLTKYHRYGRYADLEFKAELNFNHYKLTFFQNINYKNIHGGYYDFDKLEKMPYLVRKQYELTEKKIIEFLKSQGFEVEYRQNRKKGEEFIVEDYIQSWHHPQKEPFKLSEIDGQTAEHSYNNKDRDEKTIFNGEIKYFRDYSGYLARGKVYHNINNMWWVLLLDGRVNNKADFELFDLTDNEKRGRVKAHMPPKEYVLRKEQLSKCTIKELQQELKRRVRE